jgi:thymidylate synthase
VKVLHVRNVNQALQEGLKYLYEHGVREDSRAGPVLVSPVPVTTVYSHPQERVLFSAARDANPVFHLMESLWLLAGRNDARWLDQFVHDFSLRFAEEDGTLHGSYGYRWLHHFEMEGGGHPNPRMPNQLSMIASMLTKNPQDRQAVLTMWDPVSDLGIPVRDKPCNTHCYFRVRRIHYLSDNSDNRVLDITVCCRSNDLIWGLAGSNAVQFAFLQEYLAARIGVGVGTYYQISNNFHAYLDVLDKLEGKAILEEGYTKDYPGEVVPLVKDPNRFDTDLHRFFAEGCVAAHTNGYANPFFTNIAVPLYWVHRNWKVKNIKTALALLETVQDSDWRLSAEQWISRRMSKKAMR